MTRLVAPGIALCLLAACAASTDSDDALGTDALGTEGAVSLPASGPAMLIVLAAPPVAVDYYADVRERVIAFQLRYARQIIAAGDRVLVLVDRATRAHFADQLPPSALLEAELGDIWLRDFSPVLASHPLSFRYSAAAQSGSQRRADRVQRGLRSLIAPLGLRWHDAGGLILDGGNFVDSGGGRVVLSEKFLRDNQLDKAAGLRALHALPGIEAAAIIPSDDPDGLAHADGMLMFIAEDVIAVNRYDEPLRSAIGDELRRAFGALRLIELAADFETGAWDARYSSACGISVNATVTARNLYLPHFGRPRDDAVLRRLRAHTARTIIPVDARDVCFMGGSVRCLSWQLSGDNAARLLAAAARPTAR